MRIGASNKIAEIMQGWYLSEINEFPDGKSKIQTGPVDCWDAWNPWETSQLTAWKINSSF